MSFKEGEKLEEVCPKCGKDLVFEMSFQDQFSYSSGHYTIDVPLKVCESCDYSEEVESEGVDYDE